MVRSSVGKTKRVKQEHGALSRRPTTETVEPRDHGQILASGQTDLASDCVGVVNHIMAEHTSRSVVRQEQGCEYADNGCLAGTVRAEQTEHASPLDGQIHTVDCLGASKVPFEAVYFDCRCCICRHVWLFPYSIAFRTSATIRSSSAWPSSTMANDVAHMFPSSRFATSLNPMVEYLESNFPAA